MGTLNEQVPPGGRNELESLAGAAASADAARDQVENPELPGAVQDEPAGGPDYAQGGAMVTDMVVGMIVGFEPACAEYWPDETKAQVATAAAAVMEKYQITMDSLPVEFMLLALAGPPLYQCSKLIAMKMNNPPASSTQGKAADPGNGSAAQAAASAALVVHGQESGTVMHSAEMMKLQT